MNTQSSMDSRSEPFAIVVVGDTMAPRYENGETVFVQPCETPAINDYVLIRFEPGVGRTTTDIGRLLRSDGDHVVIGHLNPLSERKVSKAAIASICKVLNNNDLFCGD